MKNQAYVKWQNDPSSKSRADKFRHLIGQAKKGLCKMKDHWWNRKADKCKSMQTLTTPNNSSEL